jgi:3-oxoacyl-[acyl-carrier protein] reductase
LSSGTSRVFIAPLGADGVEGRTIVISGASGGLGAGIAEAAAASGARVVVAARRVREGSDVVDAIVASGGEAMFVPCDVADRADAFGVIERAVDAFGRVDAVIHNASSARSSEPLRIDRVTIEDWRDHASVSITGLLNLAQPAFPQLRLHRGSLLVLTSSTGVTGHGVLPLYAAVKGAQRGFVKCLAREWGQYGIRVNCLAPHAETPATRRYGTVNPAHRARDVERASMKRLGDAVEDIGPVATFLCGPRARWITGQTLFADGGAFTGL